MVDCIRGPKSLEFESLQRFMQLFWHKILMAKFYSTFKNSSKLQLSDSFLAILCKRLNASNLMLWPVLFSINDPCSAIMIYVFVNNSVNNEMNLKKCQIFSLKNSIWFWITEETTRMWTKCIRRVWNNTIGNVARNYGGKHHQLRTDAVVAV